MCAVRTAVLLSKKKLTTQKNSQTTMGCTVIIKKEIFQPNLMNEGPKELHGSVNNNRT